MSNSQKLTLMRTFNNQLTDFVGDILKLFPTNSDIHTLSNMVELIHKSNPSLFIKKWYSYAYVPYRDHIDTGDYDFFFHKSYKDDLTEIPNADHILTMIEHIRSLAVNMDDTNLKHTMKYLQILSKLSEAYTKLD